MSKKRKKNRKKNIKDKFSGWDQKPTFKNANIDQWYEQGRMLMEQGRIPEAISAWGRVVKLKPKNTYAHYNLGSLHMINGNPQQAVVCYQHAMKLDPENAQAWCNLGVAFRHMGKYDEAVNALLESVRIEPRYAVAYANLAECYEAGNRLKESYQAATTAVKIDPKQPVAQLVLIQLHIRNQQFAEAQASLEKLLENKLPLNLQAQALSQYGRVLEKLGKPEQAFQAFVESQQLSSTLPRAKTVDRTAYPTMLKHIQSWVKKCSQSPIKKVYKENKNRESSIDLPPSPVFIVGFPRSGTTLTEQILSTHPALVSSDERPLLETVINTIKPANEPSKAWTEALERPELLEWQSLRNLYWETAYRMSGYRKEFGRFIDKLPLNIAHLSLIEHLFPDSHVLVLLRDPRDVCLSAFQQDFVPNDAMIHLTSLENTVSLYEKVMGLWLIQQSALSLPYLEVYYEDLVKDLEKTTRQVFKFLDLPFDPVVLRFYESTRNRHISTPSYHAVTKPIYKTSIGRWRSYVAPFEGIEKHLAPFIKAFGYEPSNNISLKQTVV